MQNHQITRNIDIRRAFAPVAAGTGDTQDSTVIDTLGYESIVFMVHFGAIVTGAATDVRLQHGDASDGSDAADVAGSKVTVADDQDNLIVLSCEVHRPVKRYIRARVTRAAQNSTINGGYVLLARGEVRPPAKHSTVSNTATVLVSPVAGTA